ncbi:hypothetical protein TH8_13815 [Thalassospira profundimaris]|uniref:Uncharacterized protein n=1 Tax=Thalassospira povalilytica TaxID=732237 RepID=A0ABX4R5S1_9PROT|nr:hypothetical protein CU041_14135 [Thalassospira povalilytica]RCK24644.1 hypothetical protein TH8_13815 [Thalassospira profundimaris]
MRIFGELFGTVAINHGACPDCGTATPVRQTRIRWRATSHMSRPAKATGSGLVRHPEGQFW